jgi:hypothetical protein
MGAAFIGAKKPLFAVFGCSVLLYRVASAMRTFRPPPDYLPRYRSGAFNLYSETREQVEVTDFFQDLGPGVHGGVTVYYHVKGEYKPVRLYGIRKTEEAEKKGVERMKAMNRMKICGKPPSET